MFSQCSTLQRERLFVHFTNISSWIALSGPLCSVCNNYKYILSTYLKAERTKKATSEKASVK